MMFLSNKAFILAMILTDGVTRVLQSDPARTSFRQIDRCHRSGSYLGCSRRLSEN
jgi:hypothetical protein